MLAQQLFNGLVMGAVYALFAVGFNLVFGVQRVMNLAHGALFMAGAFVSLYAVLWGVPFWLAFIIGMLAAAIIGVILDVVAFRPLRRRPDAEFAVIIASIGADMILMNIALDISDAQVQRFPFGTIATDPLRFLGLRISPAQLIICVVVILLILLLYLLLYRTSFGRQVRAVASNERASLLLGVEPRFVYMQTFFLSGLLAGAAGTLIGLAFNSISFGMGEPYLLREFVVLVLGGLGSLPGAILASLLLGVVQTLSIAYLPSGMSDIIINGVLFITLMVRPNGLLGSPVANARVARQ